MSKLEKKENDKSTLIKNYFKLIGILLATVIGVVLIRNYYHNYNENNMNTSIVGQTLIHAITVDELNNYINENSNTTLYITYASDDDCRSFEENVSNEMEKRKLEDDIIYLDMNDMSDSSIEIFFNNFNKKYSKDNEINNYPTIVKFEDGKVVDVAGKTDKGNLTVKEFTEFLDDNGIVSIN